MPELLALRPASFSCQEIGFHDAVSAGAGVVPPWNKLMTQVLLKDISEIRAGYSFRGRIKPKSGGRFSVVQIKDLDVGGLFQPGELLRTDLSDVNPNHLLHAGDVLFVARGERKRAVVIDEIAPNTVFGSQFFGCRSKSGIDPTYLAWFINQKPA